jgi:phosphoribosyl-ATP pyrophosphohydrolase
MTQPTTDQVILGIVNWADDRGILAKSAPLDQMRKTTEELGELWQAVASEDRSQTINELGDYFVCGIVQCEMQGVTVQDVLFHALGKLQGRTKGQMIDGLFVREK